MMRLEKLIGKISKRRASNLKKENHKKLGKAHESKVTPEKEATMSVDVGNHLLYNCRFNFYKIVIIYIHNI